MEKCGSGSRVRKEDKPVLRNVLKVMKEEFTFKGEVIVGVICSGDENGLDAHTKPTMEGSGGLLNAQKFMLCVGGWLFHSRPSSVSRMWPWPSWPLPSSEGWVIIASPLDFIMDCDFLMC
ncbi:hypothetical protein VNO77_04099 [Canavalia gladiata]|uniref:Uncharacterized protein n=1 Tax=Canavalia gladiata TaxID=3824 RepID=A0AAN9N135_CANGL